MTNVAEVNSLIKNMTLREKLGQCIMIEPVFCLEELNREEENNFKGIDDPDFLDLLINKYHVGTLFFGGVTRVGDDSAKAWADYMHTVSEYNKDSRVEVPLFYASDAVHGVNFIKGSTIYTHNLGASSTFNPELIKKYTNTVAKELKSLGLNLNFSPTIDVARDQRWGRVYESLGEDPFLASRISEKMIEGINEAEGISGCAKHFIGYGQSNTGMDRTSADLSDRDIMETHLPPFVAAINAGVKAIMVNGGDLNGIPMPASKKMMTGLLRDKLGYEGVTMSDWEDVYRLYERHKVVKSRKDAVIRAFNAGLDMNMAVTDLKAVDVMEEAVNSDLISMERVNEAVSRIISLKMELGLFNNKEITEKDLVGNEESKKIARQLALESAVLLKNDNNLLPINKDVKSMLVIGQGADSKRHLCGGWTMSWASAEESDLDNLKIIESLRNHLPGTRIDYISDLKLLKDINKEDYELCLAVITEEPVAEWQGDSDTLQMESSELNVLKAARRTGLPTVVVSLIGRPVDMNYADKFMDAILLAYMPGTEGAEAVYDLLFGNFVPSGRITMSYPKNVGQIPVVYNVRSYQSNEVWTKYEPLYPFGYGLSYTKFEYSDLKVAESINDDANLKVKVTVENTGNYDADEIVMIYLRDIYASVSRPLKSLKTFKKIRLANGEKKEIELVISNSDLGLYDEEMNYVIEKRRIELTVADLTAEFEIV